jgi:hypothetical protein
MAAAKVGAQLMYIGPVVAALAALHTLRRRRQLAGGPGFDVRRVLAAQFAAQVVWALAPVAAGVVCAAVVNFGVGAAPGWVAAPYLLLAAVFAVECAALGHLLGALGGPLWFAPVVSLIVVFVREVFATSTGVGWAASFTRLVNSGPPWLEVSPRGLLLGVVEAGVVVVLALALPGLAARLAARFKGRVLRWGWLRVGVAVVVAAGVVGGAGVVLGGPTVIVPRAAPSEVVCTDTATRVCVWPESAVHLPVLSAMADRADGVAASLGVAPPAPMYELGLDDDASTFVMVNSTTWFMSGVPAGDIAWSVEPPTCEMDPDGLPAEDAAATRRELRAMIQLVLEDSVRPVGMGDDSGLDWSAIEAVWQDGDEATREWIGERLGELRAINAAACP